MTNLESGRYFAQDGQVKPKVSTPNDEGSNKYHVVALHIKAFAAIKDLFFNLLNVAQEIRLFFILADEIVDHFNALPADLKSTALAFEPEVVVQKNDPREEIYKHQFYGYQATRGRSAPVVSGESLRILFSVEDVRQSYLKLPSG